MTPLAAVAIALATVSCALAGSLARSRGMPAVTGWLTTAVVAGFGWQFLPQVVPSIQWSEALRGMQICAHVGLVLVAAEAGRHAHLGFGRRAESTRAALSPRGLAGMVAAPPVIALPFVWLVCQQWFGDQQRPSATLVAFVTIALTATAVPVLVPILAELPAGLRLVGADALKVAVAADTCAWAALVALMAVAAAGAAGADIALGLGLVVFCVAGSRQVIRRLPAEVMLPLMVCGALGAGAGADLAGWHSAIGAVIFGWSLPRDVTAVDTAVQQLRPVVHTVLLPLVIVVAVAHAPLVVDDAGTYVLAGELLLIALACKLIPAFMIARRCGRTSAEAGVFAALVNARGATEIVIALIGVESLGVPGNVAAALVLVAVVSTVAVAPVLMVSQRSEAPAALTPMHAASVAPRQRRPAA